MILKVQHWLYLGCQQKQNVVSNVLHKFHRLQFICSKIIRTWNSSSFYPTKLKAIISLPLRIETALSKCLLRLGKSGLILLKNSSTGILVKPAAFEHLTKNCFLGGLK